MIFSLNTLYNRIIGVLVGLLCLRLRLTCAFYQVSPRSQASESLWQPLRYGKKFPMPMSISSDGNDLKPLQKGSYVALITPMTSTGDVDVATLRSVLRWHVDSRTDGLCILGTTGEASTCTMSEREKILRIAVEEVKGKIPILAGTGTIDPKKVKEQTMQALDLGCDAALVVTPYYVKPPQRGLIQHYFGVADLGLPIVMYNVPGRTGVDIGDDTIKICSDHENIIGLKDATGNLDRVTQIRELCGEDFLLLSGDDDTSADYVLRGGDGCISVTANVDPSKMRKIMSLCLEGRKDEAKQLNSIVDVLHNNLFVESNPIPVKWALHKMGRIPSAFCRPPLDELDPKFHHIISESLQEAKLI